MHLIAVNSQHPQKNIDLAIWFQNPTTSEWDIYGTSVFGISFGMTMMMMMMIIIIIIVIIIKFWWHDDEGDDPDGLELDCNHA